MSGQLPDPCVAACQTTINLCPFKRTHSSYLPLRGVNTRIWPTPSNKPSPACNTDVKSLYFFFTVQIARISLAAEANWPSYDTICCCQSAHSSSCAMC